MIKEIDGIAYIVGENNVQNSGEIYKVSNRWKKPDELFWCNTDKEYRLVSKLVDGYVHGMISETELGFFKKEDSISKNNIYYQKSNMENMGFVRNPYTVDQILRKSDLRNIYFTQEDGSYRLRQSGGLKTKYKQFDTEIYSFKDLPSDYKEMYYRSFDTYYDKIRSRFPMLERIMNKSVGVEFETSCGHLEEHKCLELGLIPLKDGSIGGHEYVTLPYIGNVIEKCVQACTNLRYNTAVDEYCSTHVHIGGLRTDRIFLVSLYELWSYIQDEFYELIVINKRSVKYLANKKQGPKDHCKAVPKINSSHDLTNYYKTIFTLFNSSCYPNSEYNRGKLVHANNQKWNIDCRYYNLNMINMLNGGNVVEFRIHGPTLNEVKLVNYLLILNAILEFASKYSNIIMHRKEKIYLEKIIKIIYKDQPEISKTLVNYINHRKNLYLSNVLNNEVFGQEIFDETPPTDCNVLALFGYNMQDNEYQKMLAPIMDKAQAGIPNLGYQDALKKAGLANKIFIPDGNHMVFDWKVDPPVFKDAADAAKFFEGEDDDEEMENHLEEEEEMMEEEEA